jgi:RNA polymerase sigma-70 factor (ECF subfamily)
MTAEEFKTEVIPIGQKLFRFAFRMLGIREESEDIAQETFLKLWTNRDKLDEIRNIDAFAMTITRNLCLDRMKSKAYQNHQMPGEADIIEANGPDILTVQKDEVRMVKKIIDSLPDHQKMIIHLRDVEGLEFEEIAEILDSNVNAVRVNLSRARKYVKDALVKINEYEFKGNRKNT